MAGTGQRLPHAAMATSSVASLEAGALRRAAPGERQV
jgi:hypothetical protein